MAQNHQGERESVADRIAALRDAAVDDRITALRRPDEEAQELSSVEDRIAVPRKQNEGIETSDFAESEEPLAYPLVSDPSHFSMTDEPPPAYYPLANDMEGGVVTAYPVDLDHPVTHVMPLMLSILLTIEYPDWITFLGCIILFT